MSSTARGYDRHASDYYITPIDKILEFLNEFNKKERVFHNQSIMILDPSAGGDSNYPMSYPTALEQIGIHKDCIKTMDIREDSLAEIKGDYLNTTLDYKPNVILTNPPFLFAREFIEKALNDVSNNGFVIMLQRLNFFGGKKRKDLWEKHMPKYTFVHSKRISFTPDGKTDSIEYAHYVWQKGHYPEFTQLKVI
ncbi:hypothetical protein JK635_02365 [Neobacillus sp. YIM B02564]|uniref:SAM-dependent methyltransferase n=1 Tax=Neobacillus paridis TaxID=2803862 RepID=A0ABS1TID8_9BACI|nr:hypothetical protein [Neobacillus paridis]MBL4951084.1 hypothetical protein [Neobacillus paridis]